MSSEECDSHSINFPIFIAEVDRLSSDNKEKTPFDRQLCGIIIQCAKHYIGVSIHTATGAVNYHIPRNFPDKAVYIQVGDTGKVVTYN
jgi:hypothetical protein